MARVAFGVNSSLIPSVGMGQRACKLWLITGFRREVQRARGVRANRGGHHECQTPQRPSEENQDWVYVPLCDFRYQRNSSLSPPPLIFLFDLRNIKNIMSHLFVLKSLLQDFSGLRLRAFLPVVQSSKCVRGKKKRRRIANSIN